MPIDQLIGPGIGFSPGSVKYLITRGLSSNIVTGTPVVPPLVVSDDYVYENLLDLSPLENIRPMAPLVNVLYVSNMFEAVVGIGTRSIDGGIMTKHAVFQGDSSDIRRVRFGSVNVTGTVCRQVVRNKYGSTPIIDHYVTGTTSFDSALWFEAVLTPAQTNGLDVGIYQWVVELQASGTSPPLRRELHDVLEIKSQGV